MDLELGGRTAVVTGASKGIGLAITRALAGAGAHVVAGAQRSSAELDELADGGRVRFVPVNLADPTGPGTLTVAAGARIDILVNNVGSARPRPGGFLSITEADWEASLALNLLAAVRTTRGALPAMLAAGRGSIITICSVNAPAARPFRPGLQHGQGRPGRFLEGAVQGGRAAWHPGQHSQPGTGGDRPVARPRRGRRDGRRGDRGEARGGPERGRTADGDRTVHPARRGR
jgi:NAD(P)-dependent dehydrogenase (short-subunit alcohol dehydrogenase family)